MLIDTRKLFKKVAVYKPLIKKEKPEKIKTLGFEYNIFKQSSKTWIF